MLSYAETMKILNSFYGECYSFWIRNGFQKQDARKHAQSDIEELNNDPYDPFGKPLDKQAQADFLKHERERL